MAEVIVTNTECAVHYYKPRESGLAVELTDDKTACGRLARDVGDRDRRPVYVTCKACRKAAKLDD